MTLINRYLPSFQFVERHQLVVIAPAAVLLDAAARPETTDDPWVKTFVGLREIPARLFGALGGRNALANKPAFGLNNFTFLGRDANREIAFGLAGKFWQLDYGLADIGTPEAFELLATRGVPKLVLNFRVEPASGGGSTLTTETRVFCNDRRSYLLFLPYWWIIRPVSGFMRHRLLMRVRDAATLGQAQTEPGFQ